MSDVDELVATFEALRVGDGLTAKKLEQFEGRKLLDLLTPTGSGDVGLQVLDQLIDDLSKPQFAWTLDHVGTRVQRSEIPRSVRVALAVGDDQQGQPLRDHGQLDDRRDWASLVAGERTKQDLFFQAGGPKTHTRYEAYGFRALARLIISRAENPAFLEATRQQLANPSLIAPVANTEDPLNQDDTKGLIEPGNQVPAGLADKTHAFFRDLRGALSRYELPPPADNPENLTWLQTLHGMFLTKGRKKPLPATERQYMLRVAVVSVAVLVMAALILGVAGVMRL
ncbi:hypothetical protein [Catenulispora yoronensis]|uniref:hypothetical protein n=1 Tax=Catenulispora yoronensis TaxID=450799 RepID=UPI0031D502EB